MYTKEALDLENITRILGTLETAGVANLNWRQNKLKRNEGNVAGPWDKTEQVGKEKSNEEEGDEAILTLDPNVQE
jgi:hypothetical protein